MAIEKSYVKGGSATRLESEFSVGSRSRESMSSDDEQLLRRKETVDSEDDDEEEEYDDADSGAGSDDFDLLELGETRSEFCQVGDQTCGIPFELYDLPDLHGVLSLDVWNECLTEEERFGLTKYLPDMDQETFMGTLKELFDGSNFHFGSPITKMFQMLKGGLCEPRVSLYRQGLSFFQKHKHYHLLRKHQDSMVSSFLQMKEAWHNCKGYSIEEKLRVLNIVKSQKSLMGETNGDMGSDCSEEEESGEALWGKRSKGKSAWQKAGHDPVYGVNRVLDDVFSQGRSAIVGPVKSGKKNQKGSLKMAGSKTPSPNEAAPHAHSHHRGYQSMIPDAFASDLLPARRGGKAVTYDAMTARRMRDQPTSGDDERGMLYEMPPQREWNVVHCNAMDRGRSAKSGKKHEAFRVDEYGSDRYSSFPFAAKNDYSGHGRNLNINQLSDIKVLTSKPSNSKAFYDPAQNAKYMEPAHGEQLRSLKGRAKQMALKGNLADFLDVEEPYWTKNSQGEAYYVDPSLGCEDRGVSSRKLKSDRDLPESRLKALQTLQHQMDDRKYHARKRAKLSQENMTGSSVQNGRMFVGGEETESDSSDQLEEDEENRPLIMTKLGMHGHFENSRFPLSRTALDRREKRAKKDVKGSALTLDGMLPGSGAMGDFGRHISMQDMETHASRIRQKVKMQHPDMLQNFTSRFPGDGYYGGLGNSNAESDRKAAHRLRMNGLLPAEHDGSFPVPMNKAYYVNGRQRGNVGHDFASRQSKYLQDYSMEEDQRLFEADLLGAGTRNFDPASTGFPLSLKKQKGNECSTEINGQEGSDCLQPQQQLPELRKRVKKRPHADNGSPDAGCSELPVPDVGMADLEQEVKPPKKTFMLITPTIHSGFSFSIIHLLSAVRMVLITSNPKDNVKDQKPEENAGVKTEDGNANHEHTNGSSQHLDVNNTGDPEQANISSLTVQEIVNRVRSNPGDPCILETQEPLQDLVRGVLKIFSSKTAPLGAKGWKRLVCYEKATKSWTWTGPAPESSTDYEKFEEVTTPDAWRIPHKMLVKLVDSFANWLKSGQETLRQIGSLPPPPLELMQLNVDEKERFRDLRAQKSLSTISKSSEEVVAYFRKEEHLRYSIPDRAFSYTAADGKKSIVAPLRRCGGKPTSKAREHFMLKNDRPPHVTVLCLVRDAAARLPGGIGTRADVCTLIRDSQYVVEDVSDAQVNQVVSGALDRLHYERDPCVQYDGERKLWVYLHRDKEEEDFEDDGTSSTKKWRRPKKDAAEQDDQVTVACHGRGEPSGVDLCSDLNAEPPCVNNEKIVEDMCGATGEKADVEVSDIPEEGAFQQMLESNQQCQENSANEDFVEDT